MRLMTKFVDYGNRSFARTFLQTVFMTKTLQHGGPEHHVRYGMRFMIFVKHFQSK